MNTNSRWYGVATALGVVVLVLLLAGGHALAKKPVKPVPTPADGGTLYFTEAGMVMVNNAPEPVETDALYPSGGQVGYQTEPDGSSAVTCVYGLPSQGLHGGRRWFLQYRKYPYGLNEDPDTEAEYHPCGTRRFELFAVSEDADGDIEAVQLTNDATVRCLNTAYLPPGDVQPWTYHLRMGRWATDDGVTDGKISFLGVRWNASAAAAPRPTRTTDDPVPDSYDIVEAGLYVVHLDWSTGKPVPVGDPDLIDVGDRTEKPQYEDLGTGGALFVKYAWSPDGDSLAFCNYTSEQDDPDYADYAPPAGQTGDSKYPGYRPVLDFPGLWRIDAANDWDLADAVQLSDLTPLLPQSWHPDGLLLAVRYGNEIYTLDPTEDGLEDLSLLVSLPRKATTVMDFHWSPEGNQAIYRVGFVFVRTLSNITIYGKFYRVDSDGSDASEILDSRDSPYPIYAAAWR